MHVPKSTQSLRLNGRQSKVIVTNYLFGSSRVVYSTASVFFAGKIGARDVLFLYGDSDQVHEAVLLLKGTSGSGTRSRVPQIRFSASGMFILLQLLAPNVDPGRAARSFSGLLIILPVAVY